MMKLILLIHIIGLQLVHRCVYSMEATTIINNKDTTESFEDDVYNCDFQNISACNMEIDEYQVSNLHWFPAFNNEGPPITDRSNLGGLFLMLHSWSIGGLHISKANTREMELPTGEGTLTFWYYIWDANDIPRIEFPKFKIFTCRNDTKAIWKRTGDKDDRWINAHIFINCFGPFKISFEGTINGSNCGIAVDDIVVTNGHIPIHVPTSSTRPSLDSVVTELVTESTFPNTIQETDNTVRILIGVVIGLVIIIVFIVSIHCCIYKRNRRRKKQLERDIPVIGIEAKRKRFQESKLGHLTSSGYMTLDKSKPNELNATDELGTIDLTETLPSQKNTTFGKTLPRLPSLPDEAKHQRTSFNMDATYEDVEDVPTEPVSSETGTRKIGNMPSLLTNNEYRVIAGKTPNAESLDADPPVYFTLSPTDMAYSHITDYSSSSMPDVVKTTDDNGYNIRHSLAARSIQQRKSSLSSLRDKLTKGFSNSSNDYDELKDDETYYEEVNVECQL